MQGIATICSDIAQPVFQVHGVNAEGTVALCRQLNGTTCCHPSRSCRAQSVSKPNVKRHKSDAVDAEAVCEVVTRANKRFGQY